MTTKTNSVKPSPVTETAKEALERIQSGASTNDERVAEHFANLGMIVEPRVDVLTYKAWQAAGRQVRKGEKAYSVECYYPVFHKTEIDPKTGKRKVIGMRKGTAKLFHINQTDAK